MNVSVSVVGYKYKKLSNGEMPLMLRVSMGKSRSMKSLGLSIDPSMWDFKKNEPKSKCPQGDEIMTIISREIRKVRELIIEKKLQGEDYSPATLIDRESQPNVKNVTVDSFYHEIIEDLRRRGKIGNSNAYLNSYECLVKFNKGKMLKYNFSSVTIKFCNNFEDWMRGLGFKDTTMYFQMKTLRAAYNKAVKRKLIKGDKSPFTEYSLSRFDRTTRKRAIPKEDIKKLMEYSNKDNFFKQLARDIFLFSYLCGGMSYTDIVHLKEENIENGVINYTRQKTHRQIHIVLLSEAIAILDYYRKLPLQTGYIFPIMNIRKHKTPMMQYNRVRKSCALVNKYLKIVAQEAGITANLTTYVARHSFATVLKRSGVDRAIISEALGHADLNTTNIYLDSFEDDQLKTAMTNLL